MEHVVANGRAKDLKAAELGSAATRVSGGIEDELWLVPIEDRRELGAVREGMRSGFTLGQYVMLVEYTGRMLRGSKASISSEVADVFARLGCTPETWGVRMTKLSGGRLLVSLLWKSKWITLMCHCSNPTWSPNCFKKVRFACQTFVLRIHSVST